MWKFGVSEFHISVRSHKLQKYLGNEKTSSLMQDRDNIFQSHNKWYATLKKTGKKKNKRASVKKCSNLPKVLRRHSDT